MLRINWRSPAAYGHAKHIPAAGFAWEYLRRNDDYRHEFQTIALTGGPPDRDLEAFADRWGLRFPMRPRRAA
ncbi:transcriptional regulator domain-containing protein [Pseudogemmobacter sonorensis]|uniref:transcriptional regulator domain-containing protein n=1 Tax=Pseudogemmobacter sonorensis TaxID=2989681 RepID=UPI0036747E23